MQIENCSVFTGRRIVPLCVQAFVLRQFLVSICLSIALVVCAKMAEPIELVVET